MGVGAGWEEWAITHPLICLPFIEGGHLPIHFSCLLECSSVLPTHSEVAFYASTKKDMVNSVVSFSIEGLFSWMRNICTKLMVNRGGVSFSNRRVKMLPLWAWLVLCNRCKFSITNAPSTTNILIITGDLKHFPLTQSILLWFSKMFFG